jgi:hypothetical protein
MAFSARRPDFEQVAINFTNIIKLFQFYDFQKTNVVPKYYRAAPDYLALFAQA